jgi:hypothetical protein
MKKVGSSNLVKTAHAPDPVHLSESAVEHALRAYLSPGASHHGKGLQPGLPKRGKRPQQPDLAGLLYCAGVKVSLPMTARSTSEPQTLNMIMYFIIMLEKGLFLETRNKTDFFDNDEGEKISRMHVSDGVMKASLGGARRRPALDRQSAEDAQRRVPSVRFLPLAFGRESVMKKSPLFRLSL